jgi:hypothetical protein
MPESESTREIFLDVRQTIDEVSRRWGAYLHGASAAYANAFDSQAKLLFAEKKIIEAVKQQETDNMVFALSILTMCLSAPLSTYFAKGLKAEAALLSGGQNEDKVIDASMKKALSFGTDIAQKRITKPPKDIQSMRSAPAPADPYVPTAVTPAEYAESLQQGADETANQLSIDAQNCYRHADIFTVEEATKIREIVYNSQYITQAPPDVMSAETKVLLNKRAKLALWFAWALERDKEYWKGQSLMARTVYFRSEAWSWGLLRQELVTLGVPASLITIKGFSPRGAIFALDMANFIDWAWKPEALYTVLSGFRWSDKSMSWIIQNWYAKHGMKPPASSPISWPY